MSKRDNNPKTDDGTKKSQKGKVALHKEKGLIKYRDELMLNDKTDDLMIDVFKDGKLLVDQKFSDIRKRLAE